ncbi:MAG: toxin-antitoxin system YwqK family antitoxin [Planctomycetota bacterium]
MRPFLTVVALLGVVALTSESLGQRSGVSAADIEIEPYEGPPIFLPESELPPAPKEVDRTVIAKSYEGTDTPRFERNVVRYSDNTVKSDGPMKEYFENGQVFVEGQYEAGKPTGTWKYYYPNGQIAKELSYKRGQPEGAFKVFNEEGKLVAEREYTAGKRTGKWSYYLPETEQLLREERYAAGRAQGEWKTFYKNGQVRQITQFDAGQLNGPAREWTKLGEQRAVAEFKDGKRHGKTTLYEPDGAVVERLYDEGQLVDQKRIEPGESGSQES